MTGLADSNPSSRPFTHGTVQGYLYRGCRCDECKQARRAYYGQRPLAEVRAEREPGHGTEGRYTHYGCRCDGCRQASAVARRERRHRQEARA